MMTAREREEILSNSLYYIKPVARSIARIMPVNTCDLIAPGFFGLLDAIDKFKPEYNVKFRTYAKFRIHGAIIDSCRNFSISKRTALIFFSLEVEGRTTHLHHPGRRNYADYAFDNNDPHETLLRKERLELLRKAIDRLPEPERIAMQLYCDGLFMKDIGARLGITESGVSMRLKSARQRLQSFLT